MSSTWTWIDGAIGGAMIGAASVLLLASHGRIAGISGIANGAVARASADRAWRLAFLGGLAAVGIATAFVAPAAIGAPVRSVPAVIAAGLLVGYGTQLGSGCTSGHGVCGLARRSARSLVAVATFLITGAITAMIAGRLA